MEITGRIKVIGMVQDVSPTFRKRELVVTTEEQYAQHILINFVQDKCDLLNNFRLNQQVKVHLNLRGREWVNPQGETRYFNDIQGWKIDDLEQNQNQGYSNNQQSGYHGNGSAVNDYMQNQQGYGQSQQGFNNNQGFQQNNQGFNNNPPNQNFNNNQGNNENPFG